MPNLIRFAFITRPSRWNLARRSAPSRGLPVYTVGFALLCTALAAPAWSGEAGAFQTFLGLADFPALPLKSHGDPASSRERVTLDEAIALALDANRLVTNPERRQLVREGVAQAYDAVLRAWRALEIRKEALKMCRELDRLTVEQADRGEVSLSVVLGARAALAKAKSDVLSARQELEAWSRQLNHLMGRDPQARLLVTREAEPTPAAAIRLGVTATGQ